MPSSRRLDAIAEPVNRRIVAALVTLQLGVLLAVPLVVPHAVAAAVAVVVVTLMSPPLWAAIHEAVHGHLLPPAATNERVGRLLGVLHGSPFDVLRYGHLSHHRNNGEPIDRPDVWDMTREPRWRAVLRHYGRLLGGVYLMELAALPAAALPREVLERGFDVAARHASEPDEIERARRHFLQPHRLARIRTDALLIVMSWIGLAVLWGPLWPWLLAALAGRALLVSLLDNAPHYGSETGDRDQGYDTSLPGPIERLMLNMNYHGTHHRHPNVPWHVLPEAFAADRGPKAGSLVTAVLRQLAGPGRAG